MDEALKQIDDSVRWIEARVRALDARDPRQRLVLGELRRRLQIELGHLSRIDGKPAGRPGSR